MAAIVCLALVIDCENVSDTRGTTQRSQRVGGSISPGLICPAGKKDTLYVCEIHLFKHILCRVVQSKNWAAVKMLSVLIGLETLLLITRTNARVAFRKRSC
jgi:hypothetical protein